MNMLLLFVICENMMNEEDEDMTYDIYIFSAYTNETWDDRHPNMFTVLIIATLLMFSTSAIIGWFGPKILGIMLG